MSAYKEKMLAENRIAEIKARQDTLQKELFDLCYELRQAYERLAEAERDVKWEAQNDR